MSTLGLILLFSFIGSIASLIGGLILLSREKLALKISHLLASFAAGTLLATAFFDLLPEALDEGAKKEVDIFLWTLIGIGIFFLIERLIHWYHHHEYPHQDELKSIAQNHEVPLILIGDTIHNFIDGIVIATTFLVSVPLGIITSLSVATHEIPQEIGDVGILLHQKVPRKKVIIYNIVSALFAMLGALITFAFGDLLENFLPVLLALTAGFFIYIALADIIPEIHHEKQQRAAVLQSVLFLSGILIVYSAIILLETP